MEASDDEFDALVSRALDRVPPDLASLIDNVVVLVEPEAPGDPDLLGVYVGTPLTLRDSNYTFVTPDRIEIYRRPLLAMCADAEELVEEVTITVIHEIAHHFGIDDERLHDLGWG